MDRTSPPSFQKSTAFKLPTPERVPLAGAAELIYLPSSLNEAVKIEFVFEAGRLYEPNPGIAQFTLQLLSKGVPGKDANQIANQLDYYGAHLEVNAGFDYASLSLYVLRKNVKHLLPLLLSIVQTPMFPEKELTNYREITIENLKVQLEKNSFIASNLIRKKIFGTHPYGGSFLPEDAARIKREDVQLFFESHVMPSKIFIVGRVESDDLHFLINQVEPISSFNAKNNIEFEQCPATTDTVPGPNKIQASLKLGRKTISRLHPDVAALQLTNHLLGGFFGSRLMKNIREEKGLTYGIHSSIQNLKLASMLIISSDLNADKLDTALAETKREIQELPKVSLGELEITKNHLIGSIQNDITTVFAAGEKIKTIILANLPMDYYQNLILNIDQVEPEDLGRICAQHFGVEGFSGVAVR
jgi:zinc protease